MAENNTLAKINSQGDPVEGRYLSQGNLWTIVAVGSELPVRRIGGREEYAIVQITPQQQQPL
ncbi:hypothetical protein QQS21_010582 [Conoideocrella luteorostrata]|uniref:Uncharacterized protein n=1 Tax=Conoideocrella luteorostrata TaxID=1105319 RepID=A0AAJ0CER4_9HYPO|nr:hypothetical protein QQS21_010582 [Conoideocrella luteorostrata]